MQAIFLYQKTWLLLLGDSPNLYKWIVFVNFKMMFTLILILLHLKEKYIWPLTLIVVFFPYMDCQMIAISNPVDKDDSVPHWVFLFSTSQNISNSENPIGKSGANNLLNTRLTKTFSL